VKATVSTRKALAIVLSAIVLTAIVTYVFAASSNIPITIGGGIYPGAPSYTIWREGNYFFAKNSSGAKVFSGTNATQVIQNALNKKGVILLLAGTYPFDANITIKDRTTLIGEAQDSVILQRSTDNVAIIVESEVAWTEAITIKRLTIHGNNKNGDLVRIVSARSVRLVNVAIKNSAGVGLHVLTGAWGVQLENLHIAGNDVGALIEGNKVTLSGCILRLNNEANINITSNGIAVTLTDCVIEKAQNNGAYNMYITGGTYEDRATHLIKGCYFEDAPTNGGNVFVSGIVSTNITGITFIGNLFAEDSESIHLEQTYGTLIIGNHFWGSSVGINITSSAYNTLILGNLFTCNTNYTDNGSGTIIQNNIG